MHLPNTLYVALAAWQPGLLAAASGAIAVEQFGCGCGFTAHMVFMLQVAAGEGGHHPQGNPHKTAHFALCTGFMALGMMLPGMWSGWLQQQLQPRLDSEVRSTLLGHTQRGGTPTAYDRVLATRFGWAAAELVREGRFGRMVVLRGEEIDSVEIAGIAGRSRPVPPDHPLLRAARDTGVMLGH